MFLMRRLLLLLSLCAISSSCREMVEKEADEKIFIAESALLQGEWATADESFHEAILLDPDRAEAWIGRGMTLTRLDEKESARKHYEEALLLYEKRPPMDEFSKFEPIRRRIMLLVLLDRKEEAMALANATADNNPDEEFAQSLTDLVEKIETEFQDMILHVAEEETAPILKGDSSGSLR